MTREEADIKMAKEMIKDMKKGIYNPLAYYEKLSDEFCGEASRGLFVEKTKE